MIVVDNEFHLKMMVMAIALIACGEQVNNAMITRLLELLVVYSNKSVQEVVLLAFSLLYVSTPNLNIVDQIMHKTTGGNETNVIMIVVYLSIEFQHICVSCRFFLSLSLIKIS